MSVDGQPAQGGHFTAQVTRDVDQSLTIVVQGSSQPATSHHVRCLPANFPHWAAQRSGSPQAEWYIAAPIYSSGKGFPVIFDNNGVPVWWWDHPTSTVLATLLPDGNVGWTLGGLAGGGGAEEHALDGSLVRSINTVGGTSDIHDLIQLPNGDFVMVANQQRSNIDLSALGGPAAATILDHVIEELDPSGAVLWSWDTADRIPVSEMASQWYQQYVVNGTAPHDVYHFNSIDYTGSGFVVSFRHADAVYNIDKTTGNILWKVGGSPRLESLAISGDPVFNGGGGFGGQHDARLIGDGSLTLHDNGTNQNRAPRAVHYALDTSTRTATLVEQAGDSLVTASACCGSVRKLPGENWTMGWGGSHVATEMTPAGDRVFLLQFPNATLYRAVPIPFGQLSRDSLRNGMDAQYPPSATPHTAGGASSSPAPTPGGVDLCSDPAHALC